MFHFRACCAQLLDAAAVAPAFGARGIHAEVSDTPEGFEVAFGRWGSLRARRMLAVDTGPTYDVAGQASATALASTLGVVLVSLGAELFGVDGQRLVIEERFALRGPLVANDAEARDALAALRAGDASQVQPLVLYVRSFLPRESTSDVRSGFIAWCKTEAREIAAALDPPFERD